MLKILYAADNRVSSHHTLKRFLDTYSPYYTIKIAAYSKSIQNLNANWNLDALLDFRSKWYGITFENSNYPLFVRELKRFAPDLVISDLELYSSYAAINLGIPVWQVSPMLLYYAVENRRNRNFLFKFHSGLYQKDIERHQYYLRIINNSQKKLILSHLGDLINPPTLQEGFQWVRPNYQEYQQGYSHCSVRLSDAYYSNQAIDPIINYDDIEDILLAHYNHKYKLNQPFETTINNDVHFLSSHLKMFDI